MMEDKVLYELLQVMLDNKAEDLVYLNVSKVNPLAEFYVICTVASNRQALALSRYVDDCLAKNNITVKHIEGNSTSEWILVDGIDIKKIKLSSLRKHFGQMLQDVFIFSGTIRSNIVLREENITDEEIMQACKYVNADHFINKLEKGLDEEVRERGNNFSAGQRQLISFARTIVHKPEVMILDEATANIDTETEVLIQDSLEKMMNIGTMIIVAHRLSTIQHADNIIVLSHGEILEQGNHQELLKQKGQYYKLYQLQFNKEKLK